MASKAKMMHFTTIAQMPLLSRVVLNVAFTVAAWHMHSVTRKDLRKLDGHFLQDIGLDAETAYGESTKRFWQD